MSFTTLRLTPFSCLPLLLAPSGLALQVEAAVSEPPIAGAEPADTLIREGESHFAHLWKLTSGGENAEGYWSFDGQRLSFQARYPDRGVDCDRIFVTDAEAGHVQVSNGNGTTTCAYFMPDGESVIFASTHSEQESCPPPPDYSQGYVWPIRPEFELYLRPLASEDARPFLPAPGYDAEATVSHQGDRVVFTSMRGGDLDLWTCALDGTDLKQVTDTPGYDGGAFFSHDGQWLVWRSTHFTPGSEAEEIAEYQRLLGKNSIRPTRLEIQLSRADGSERKQVTDLGGANFAPSFFPDDQRIIFASNHHDQGGRGRNFDLFACDRDGGNVERITFEDSFDSFPHFSPDGRYLAFSSNRGGSKEGETNLFIAEWK